MRLSHARPDRSDWLNRGVMGSDTTVLALQDD